MSSCIGHQQHQFAVVLIPDEKPIRSDVAFPIAFILSMKNVWIVFLWQTTFCRKNIEHIGQQLLIVTSLETTLE